MAKRLSLRQPINFKDISKNIGDKVSPINKVLIPTIDLENPAFDWEKPVLVTNAYVSNRVHEHPVQLIEVQENIVLKGVASKSILVLGAYFTVVEKKILKQAKQLT